VKDRTAAKNRAKTLTLSLLRKHNAQRLDQIERQIQGDVPQSVEILEAGVAH
jgi:transposase